MDREALWATVHGVAESDTISSNTHIHCWLVKSFSAISRKLIKKKSQDTSENLHALWSRVTVTTCYLNSLLHKQEKETESCQENMLNFALSGDQPDCF